MKKNLLKFMAFCSILAGLSPNVAAQTVYDVNFGILSFLANNATNRVGNGQSAGDVVTYDNVITIGSDEIDCIIRTVSINNGSFNVPTGCGFFGFGTCTGNPFDWADNAPPSISNNLDSFFSPLFDFGTGGGTVTFRFEFIEDGSFNTSTNTGTTVILENVRLNTYDIDGNNTSGSNQFNRFEQFSLGEYATGGNIVPTINTSNGLTQFRSNSDQNTTNVQDENTRIRISYDRLSAVDIQVGAEAAGPAYFFIDFSPGANWTVSLDSLEPPVLDLDPPVTNGIDNGDAIRCQQQIKLVADSSETNIITTSTVLFEMDISFASADIDDGANEKLNILGATSGGEIALNFANNASINDVVFFGNTFEVEAVVANGESLLRFTPPSAQGSYALAVWERFLDSMQYENETFSCTFGPRRFDVSVRNNVTFSPPARYTANINAPVPVTLLSFDANCEGDMVQLNWITASEIDNDYFDIQRSFNGEEWMSIGQIQGAGNSQQLLTYEFTDVEGQRDAFYRFKQVDFDGTEHLSPIVRSRCFVSWEESLKVYPNPTTGRVVVELPYPFEATLYNLQGQAIMKESGEGMLRFDGISAGSYILNVNYDGMQKHVKLIVQ